MSALWSSPGPWDRGISGSRRSRSDRTMIIEERSNMKPVCLVIGAGAGIGGTVARRFAQEGYHACLCRRSDSEGLNRLVNAIKSDGGSATGFLLNATAANSIDEGLAAIAPDIVPIQAAVSNVRSRIADRA